MSQSVQEHLELATAQQIWTQLTQEHAPEDWWQTTAAFAAWTQSSPLAQPLPLWAAYDDQSQPVALLPVRRESRSILGARLRLLEMAGDLYWRPGSPILGGDPETSIAILLEGLRHHPDWDMLQLGPMLQESPTVHKLLDRARRAGFWPQICRQLDDPVVRLRGSWDRFYSERSGNLRSQVKRGEAKLQHQGVLALEEYTGGPDLDARLREFLQIEASGWKGREGTAIVQDPLAHQFYTRLAHEAAPHGHLRLYFLHVGDHCIAADYCLACAGTVYMLKVGYDEAWSHCSPGQVMRKRVLEHLSSQGRDQIYDMLPGGGEHRGYKTRWANWIRPYVMVRLFNPRSIRGQLAATGSRLRAWLRQRTAERSAMAESPPAAASITTLLAVIGTTGLFATLV